MEAGATYIGLVFFPPSPRFLSVADAKWVAEAIPEAVTRVALTVDPTDEELEAILDAVPIDMLQLQGDETPERVTDVRRRFGRPVMKALGIGSAEDLAAIDVYAGVADQLLLDARPDGGLPGGNGNAFDWNLIRDRRWTRPWMLAGGLTPENVGEAIARTGATQVDVSSGVERQPGFKDPALVRAFIEAAVAATEPVIG